MKFALFLICILVMSCSCQTAKPAPVEPSLSAEEESTETPDIPMMALPPKPVIMNGYRMLLLQGAIDSSTTEPLVDALASHNGIKGFVLEINSGGGEVDPGFLLSKAIEHAGVPVHCIVDGDTASMAFYILQSCTTRSMTKRSVLMLHNPAFRLMRLGEDANAYLEAGERLTALQNAMMEQYLLRMKITKKELQDKLSKRAWWMGHEEAKEVGAVDNVFTFSKEIWAVVATYK